MTPLVGVLLVVCLSVVTVEVRSFSVDVPRRLDAGCGGMRDPNAYDHMLRVALRADLSAGVLGAGIASDVEPSHLAPLVRHAVTVGADVGVELDVIYVEADDDVRWGDLVSTFDTMRGVAPDALIALETHAETAAEGLR
ncbi:MAG: hypothetical protein HOV81_11440 [Kofleriaceae bacterium]|nr:hypothetical protein [Kofleriaceae bacterium]